MASLILSIQERVVDRLRRIPELGGLAVVTRKPKQTLSDLEKEISTLTAGFYVWPPLLSQVRPNSTGLFVETIEVRVSAFENVALNNSHVDVYRLVELGLYYLHHCELKIEGISTLYATEEPVQEESNAEQIIFDLTFACAGGFDARPAHI